MTQAMIQRIVWKEYRTFRGFWICIAVLTLLLQWFVVYANRATADVPLQPTYLPFMALAMTMFYVLGVGATLFSMEHEQQTYEQLRAWPSTFQVVWLGKLLFAGVSSMLLGLILSLVTRWIWGPFPAWLCWTAIPFATIVLSVAILCSLLIQRPLLATFAAGAVMFAGWLLNLELVDGPLRWSGNRFPILLTGCYVSLGLVGLAISYPLTARWFADRPRLWGRIRDLPRTDRPAWLQTGTARSQLTRMAWLSVRQLGWIWLGTLVVNGLIGLWAFNTQDGEGVFLLAGWPLVIGATLFAGDQSGRSYRFFAERSVSDRQLWWQRQAIGLMVFAVALAMTLPPVMGFAAWLRRNGEEFPLVSGYVSYCVLAYGMGQSASLLLRSSLLSLTITFVAALPLVAWCLLAAWFHLPWWLAVAIPAVGFWTASRLRVGHWMLDRDRLRHWLAPTAVLLATALVTVGSFYLHRVYQIPWVEPVTDTERAAQRQTPAEKKAVQRMQGRLFGFADLNFPDHPKTGEFTSNQQSEQSGVAAPSWSNLPRPIPVAETNWLNEHQDKLDDTLIGALQQLSSIQRAGELPNREISERTYLLATLLVAQARQQQQSADLAGALASYQTAMHVCSLLRPHGDSIEWDWASRAESLALDNLLFWAAAQGQTGDQLQQAIDWSREWLGREQEWTRPLTGDFQYLRVALRELSWSFGQGQLSPKQADRLIIMLSLIPGERQRWQRLLNVLEASTKDAFQRCIHDVQSRRDVTRVFSAEHGNDSYWSDAVGLGSDPTLSRAWQKILDWKASTPLMRPYYSTGWRAHHLLGWNMLLENRRRATHVRLQLIAWRLQHGEYPTTSEWQQARDDQEPPPDVLTGRPFAYLPEGTEKDVAKNVYVREPLGGRGADAFGQPLVASPESLRPLLDAGYRKKSVFPLPPKDVVLQYE